MKVRIKYFIFIIFIEHIDFYINHWLPNKFLKMIAVKLKQIFYKNMIINQHIRISHEFYLISFAFERIQKISKNFDLFSDLNSVWSATLRLIQRPTARRQRQRWRRHRRRRLFSSVRWVDGSFWQCDRLYEHIFVQFTTLPSFLIEQYYGELIIF